MRVTGRDTFKKYESAIKLLIKMFSVFGKRANYSLLKSFRNTNGDIGILLRYIFISNCAKGIGPNVSIQPNVFIFNPQNLKIGENVSIHPMCYIEAAGGITISDNVSIAHSTSLISTNHTWDDMETPIKYNNEIKHPIIICEDVWIASGVRILAGVTINKRSIIAAGAVVTRNVESNTIYGGIPAKKIKDIKVISIY